MLHRIIVLFLVAVYTSATNAGLSPILIVHGFIGSQLQARISDGSPDCDTGGNWVNYWVNLELIISKPQCIKKVLQLEYNSRTNIYTNSPGVEVRVPGFGETETVEFLDTDKTMESFYTFVEYFVAKGYERGKSIRAAPYDWRFGPVGLRRIGYYEKVKQLIEKMNEKSTDKVSIVSHSFGGPVILYFLNNMISQDWKDKYIKTFIPLSGAWSGGNEILPTFISGTLHDGNEFEQFGASFQTMESTVWLTPNPFVWKDKVIITTDTVTYSANDYEKLFDSLDRKTDYTKLEHYFTINNDYPAPNVPVHCYYGVGVDTIEVVNYGDSFPNSYDNFSYGDGDGSVNLLSSEVCLKWSREMTAPFHHQIFGNTNHNEMIKEPYVLCAIYETINTE